MTHLDHAILTPCNAARGLTPDTPDAPNADNGDDRDDADVAAFELRPSWRVGGTLVAVHALSMIPVVGVGFDAWIFAAVGLAVATHGAWSAWRFGWLRSGESIVGIELDGCARCTLSRKSGAHLTGIVDASTFIGGRLVVLSMRRPGSWAAIHPATQVIVTADMLEAHDFRRLRVLLKWNDGGVRTVQSLMPPSAEGFIAR